MQQNKQTNFIIVPIITLLVGFFSFVVFSVLNNVFWINSPYDVPLIYNMSVIIGDSILLPIINYMLFFLYFNLLDKKPKKISYLLLLFLLLSLALNTITHISWVNDHFTDFVGLEIGNFSFIGYWHLVFSSIQMAILFLFPYLWYLSIKQQNKEAISYSFKIWIYFFLFTMLGSLDMLNKYLFVYNDSFVNTIKNEGFPFITIILALVLLAIMNYFKKKGSRKIS